MHVCMYVCMYIHIIYIYIFAHGLRAALVGTLDVEGRFMLARGFLDSHLFTVAGLELRYSMFRANWASHFGTQL